MFSPRAASAGWLVLTLLLLDGCGQKGTITFVIEEPVETGGLPSLLSPFADPRADVVSFLDERSGRGLGTPLYTGNVSGAPRRSEALGPIGDIPVGTYDVRLLVQGGGQLLGMARTAGVQVLPLQPVTVRLRARKPVLFYTAESSLGEGRLPPPGELMALDTTLPLVPNLPDIDVPGCDKVDACIGAVVATSPDGALVAVAVFGRLLVVDSGRLYQPDDQKGVRTALLAGTGARPRAIAFSPDGGALAVVTDQGFHLARLATLEDGAVLPALAMPNARALAFTPDGRAATVLRGPEWRQVLAAPCAPVPSPDPLMLASTVTVGVDGSVTSPEDAPYAATDLAWWMPAGRPDQARLLFASKCRGGVVERAAGRPVIAGPGIVRLLVARGVIYALPDRLVRRKDPDPRGGVVSAAAVLSTDSPDHPIDSAAPAGASSVDYLVQAEPVPFLGQGDQPAAQVPLPASAIVATGFALAPDGARLALSTRTEFEANGERYFKHPADSPTPERFCTLNVVRQVHRVTVIDLASGNAFDPRELTGREEVTACRYECFKCDPQGQNCGNPYLTFDCSGKDGFIPGSLALTFGAY